MKQWGFLLIWAAALLTGCQEDPIPDPGNGDNGDNGDNGKEEVSELTQKINEFIQLTMTDVYYWYQQVPEIDVKSEPDPEKYFEQLVYEEDIWSYITDDVEALKGSFEGRETSFGYSLTFGLFSDSDDVFGLVEFVYPNTPAAEAGLKRGDLIHEMNGASISQSNYRDLLNAESLSISFGQYSEQRGIFNTVTKDLVARELTLNPVLTTNIVEHEGHKIGYLFYAQYIGGFNHSLDTAFQYFMEEQITDLVIDLRYNPGGGTDAARHLCSSIAPVDIVNDLETLVKFEWNDIYQQIWEDANNQDQLRITFTDTTAVQMGLNRVHVLTGEGTASASELTITGLKPYMTVTTVGDTTFGKYTASITVEPYMYYNNESYYNDFDNWGIQPIVIQYANSMGVTDFKDGFAPTIPVRDNILAGIPLGQKEDPLFAAAIEDISGVPVVAMKKAAREVPFRTFDRGFSKFDVNKRQLLFDRMNKAHLKKE